MDNLGHLDIPNCRVLSKISHPKQRNDTWLVRCGGQDAIAKRYRLLSTRSVSELCTFESQLRSGGVLAPELVYRSTHAPLVVHKAVPGRHITDPTVDMVTDCARTFAAQLLALRGTRASWAPTRPKGLPRRGRSALEAGPDPIVRALITNSWQDIADRASGVPSGSHADWRADNLLFAGNRLVAVLDWEDLISVPAAEAVGYAAAALTHSWRDEIYAPVTLDPIEVFLSCATECGVLTPQSIGQARAAALYSAAVRLAEDQARGVAVTTGRELCKALRAAP
ncbi:phosphotransferase [Streptomyces sp. NBRC 109706]|uniref:phosphotransferase n=1 Tax=Streptomyces sp. NBRC 109706 TaxID=1550035 RepID=UPI00099CA118|nr:phosphotransferase [Streptomyces sp. NBRC 109706]